MQGSPLGLEMDVSNAARVEDTLESLKVKSLSAKENFLGMLCGVSEIIASRRRTGRTVPTSQGSNFISQPAADKLPVRHERVVHRTSLRALAEFLSNSH